jgi:hypothetical protein
MSRGLLWAAVMAAAVSLGGAGCGGHAPAPPAHGNALGCSTGPLRLTVKPTSARPGQIVSLESNGSRRGGDVSAEGWGLFGQARNGRFVALYDMGATLRVSEHPGNIPSSSGAALAGTALPNRRLYVRVPHVSAGNYVIKFAYGVASGSSGPRKNYNLCARLRVIP